MRILLRNPSTTFPNQVSVVGRVVTIGARVAEIPEAPGTYYIFAYMPKRKNLPDKPTLTKVLSVREYYGSKDTKGLMIANGFSDVIGIYCHVEGQDPVLLVTAFASEQSDGAEVLPDSLRIDSVNNLDILNVYVPGSPTIAQFKAKEALLERIVTQDSLSALEKQVDLLSELVFALMYKSKAPMPQWASAFVDAVGGANTSTPDDSADAAIADIAVHKALLRDTISAYKASKE